MNNKPKSTPMRVSNKEKRILQLFKEVDIHSESKWLIDKTYNIENSSYDTIIFDNKVGAQGLKLIDSIFESNNISYFKYYRIALLSEKYGSNEIILKEFSKYSKEVTMFSAYQKPLDDSPKNKIYTKFINIDKQKNIKDSILYKGVIPKKSNSEITVSFTIDIESCIKDFLSFLEFTFKDKDKIEEFDTREKEYIKNYGYINITLNENEIKKLLDILDYNTLYWENQIEVNLKEVNLFKDKSLNTLLKEAENIDSLNSVVIEQKMYSYASHYFRNLLSSNLKGLNLNIRSSLTEYIYLLLVESVYSTSYEEYRKYITEVNEFLTSNGKDMISLISESNYVENSKFLDNIIDRFDERKNIEDDVDYDKYYKAFIYCYHTNTRMKLLYENELKFLNKSTLDN